MTDELRAKFDLLPCPFCGGRAEVVEQRDEDGRFAAVGCSKCGAGSRQHYFCGGDAREHVVSAWNKRATDAEVEALKRDAERYVAAFVKLRKMCAPHLSHQEDLMIRTIDAAIAKELQK